MTHKTGLGRGLDALIPGSETAVSSSPSEISVHLITPNPRQPRSHMDADELSGLVESIREHGVIQPIILSFDEQSGKYTLIAGERRWLAAQQAGLETIPAIIREVNDQQRLELALIENIQRADLNPLEAAEAYRQLIEEFGLSHEELSAQVGKSRVAITNTLRLLKLPETVQKALAGGQITEGHARALLGLPTEDAQSAVLHTILAKDLTVRQTEELVRKLTGGRVIVPTKSGRLPEIVALEDRLRKRLGTKVSLNQRRKGGTLVIHYYSQEELESILNHILGADSE